MSNRPQLLLPIYGGTGLATYAIGDLIYASSTSALTRLAVGSNTQILTLAGGVPTWAAPATAGTVTSVTGTTNRITSSGGATPAIDISASYVGQSSITTLGTISTGVWSGTVILVAKGGTGVATITGLVSGNGTANMVGRTITGTANQIAVTNGSGATANPTLAFSPIMVNSTQPCFFARQSGTVANVSGDSTAYTCVYDVSVYDNGSNYNATTGVFTAPVTGRYQFNCCVTLEQLGIAHTTTTLSFSNIGVATYTQRCGALFPIVGGDGLVSITGQIIIDLTAAQTFSTILTISGGTKTVDFYGQNVSSWFNGTLVC